MSVATRVSAVAVLALLGGVGIVYAPTLAFTTAAVAFVLGLWSLTKSGYPSGLAYGGTGRERSRPQTTLTTKLVSGFLLLWWLALIAPLVAYSERDITNAADSSVGGSLLDQLLVVSFSLVGVFFLPRAIRRLDSALRWVLALWALHLCWTCASLLWSVYPALTLRNAVAFTMLSVGSFGLGAGFYGNHPNGRDLFLRHLFAAGVLSALVILIPLPFRWDDYDLLDPTQRLSIGGGFPIYVVRPALCALLILFATAVLRVRTWRRRDWFWFLVLITPLLVLKSRGPILFALVAFGLFCFLYKTRVQDRVLQAGLLFVLGVGAYVYYATGVYDLIVPYLARGNVENTMALTGRIPLWEALVPEIKEHPWLGVGFAAFWNPGVLFSMEQRAGFPVVSAHNGFLDMLLGTGIIGLVIILAFCFYTMAVAIGRARRGDPLGWLVFLFVAFYTLQNLTVSTFTEFLEIPLVAILVMLGLMANGPVAGSTVARKEPTAAVSALAKRRVTTHN